MPPSILVKAPEIKDRVLRLVKNGAHIPVAMAVAGVPHGLFLQWKKSTEVSPEQDPELTEFVQSVLRAEAESEIALVEAAYEKALTDPKTAMRFLGKRYPERWGDKREVKFVDWRQKALDMLAAGEVTWSVLQEELGEFLASELRPMLPPGVEVIEGTVEKTVEVTTLLK